VPSRFHRQVAAGYLAAGYGTIQVDDCWQSSRDANGVIVPDPSKFPAPNTFEAVIANITSRCITLPDGSERCLKFGLYSDAGTATCAGRPGGLGYETTDAKTYASWCVLLLRAEVRTSADEMPLGCGHVLLVCGDGTVLPCC